MARLQVAAEMISVETVVEVWQKETAALDAAWAVGRTPLLVDMTTPAGEDKSGGGFSPLETFYSYSGEVLIELKKAVVELSILIHAQICKKV